MELLQQLQATLGDAYRIERELKGGGMARVVVAMDVALARRVVIKVLSPELAASVSSQRFAREIRLAASLQHANIVPLLSAGDADGVPHYTMPFVEGASLRERLEGGTRPGMVESIGILRDVARALAYAHERGVVHRDIKPDNVLLSGGAAMVTDFGIAKAITAAREDDADGLVPSTTVTHAGMTLGTPAYMAPEQITADPAIDHRADLYSFGCLAYELLSGRQPFAHRGMSQLVAAHLTEQPSPLGELCPECPPALVRVVQQCLEKEAGKRPATANEILRVLDGVTVSTSALTRLRNRLTRRQRRGAAVLAVSLVVAAVLVPRRNGAPEVESLAVLPFVNIGGDTSRDHWADGLTDEVMMALARRPAVQLASRTAVERYRGRRTVDVLEVGRALHVRHVLHGTVWPEGRVFRVTVALRRSDDGFDVWRNSFNGNAQDILGALDSITNGIAVAVDTTLLRGEVGAPALADGSGRGTSDSTAYGLYLRGLAHLRDRGAAVRLAAERFEEAIARDPDFAKAHAALAAALEILPNFVDTTYAEVYGRATAAARRALALDSTLARARGALALASMHALRWAEADSQFRRALALDPNDAETWMHYARLLTYTGQLDSAVRVLERAKAVDPASPVIGGWLAAGYLRFGRMPEALTEINRALELDSTSVPIALHGAMVTLMAGQRDRARALAELAWRPYGRPRPSPWPAATAEIYAALGDRTTLREILRHVESAPRTRAFHHSSLAMAAMAASDTARALDQLERATEAGEFWPSAPAIDGPWLDLLHASPRMRALVRRVGIDVDRLLALPRRVSR